MLNDYSIGKSKLHSNNCTKNGKEELGIYFYYKFFIFHLKCYNIIFNVDSANFFNV